MLRNLIAALALTLFAVPASAGVIYRTGFVFDEPSFSEQLYFLPLGPGKYAATIGLSGDYSQFYASASKRIHYEITCDGAYCGGNSGDGPAGTFAQIAPGRYYMTFELAAAHTAGSPDFLFHYDDEIFSRLSMDVVPGQSRMPIRWALVISSAPEPSSWALMLAGFGLTGAAFRRERLTRVETAMA